MDYKLCQRSFWLHYKITHKNNISCSFPQFILFNFVVMEISWCVFLAGQEIILNGSQQLPAPYKRLVDEIKQH